MYIYADMYVCVYIYIYIYIERDVSAPSSIHTHWFTRDYFSDRDFYRFREAQVTQASSTRSDVSVFKGPHFGRGDVAV